MAVLDLGNDQRFPIGFSVEQGRRLIAQLDMPKGSALGGGKKGSIGAGFEGNLVENGSDRRRPLVDVESRSAIAVAVLACDVHPVGCFPCEGAHETGACVAVHATHSRPMMGVRITMFDEPSVAEPGNPPRIDAPIRRFDLRQARVAQGYAA